MDGRGWCQGAEGHCRFSQGAGLRKYVLVEVIRVLSLRRPSLPRLMMSRVVEAYVFSSSYKSQRLHLLTVFAVFAPEGPTHTDLPSSCDTRSAAPMCPFTSRRESLLSEEERSALLSFSSRQACFAFANCSPRKRAYTPAKYQRAAKARTSLASARVQAQTATFESPSAPSNVAVRQRSGPLSYY